MIISSDMESVIQARAMNLRNRLKNSKNITSKCKLSLFCSEDSSNLTNISFSSETLNKIRTDVSHIHSQLRTLYNEQTGTTLQKSRWILNKGNELKTVFVDTMVRFKLIQQNHLNALRTKHHTLDQQSWGIDANAESKEKQKILASTLEQVQKDMTDNEYIVTGIKELYVDTVIIEDVPNMMPPPVRSQFEDVPFRDNSQAGVTETYESAGRKQRLWLIAFGSLTLLILVLLLLNVA